jgi:nicotinic acid mononucleotide adenylyltransferase
VDVSATEIRRAFAEGRSPAPGSLHPRVLHYIEKYALYR